jgi:hypothetical protein
MYPETMEEALRDLGKAIQGLERSLVILYQDVGYDAPPYVAATESLASLKAMPAPELTEDVVYAAADKVGAAFEAREHGEDGKALPNDAVIRYARSGRDEVAALYDAGKSIQVHS